MSDHGGEPYVVDIEKATLENDTYRTTLWTGKHLQLTVMTIKPGDDIGLEAHPVNDQFLRVESGRGRCQMGLVKDDLDFDADVQDDSVILVPAGTWHNVTNTGEDDLRLYALYGPPDHLPGTVHVSHEDADNDPNEH